MPESSPITLLHLSDPQFGKNHRFAQQDLSDWDAPFETLLARLKEDLAGLQKDHGLVPDLLVVTGDLAERGFKSEFEDALRFLRGLCHFLMLPPDRVAIIPGNHDINRKLCESYFSECKGKEYQPILPYWPKWRFYIWFFREFYRDAQGAKFTRKDPWSFFEMSDLKVVVAGLNSTLKESHREEDHYGWVGSTQLQWFQSRLEPYRQQGWLRIGAVHHNFRRGAVRDEENLRDADDLQRVLGSSLNLLLHGHTHEGKLDWIYPELPILSAGSAALRPEQRPIEVPNQYQIIRIWPNRIDLSLRSFAPDRKSWIGDTRASERGDEWRHERGVTFKEIHTTLPSDITSSLQPFQPQQEILNNLALDISQNIADDSEPLDVLWEARDKGLLKKYFDLCVPHDNFYERFSGSADRVAREHFISNGLASGSDNGRVFLTRAGALLCCRRESLPLKDLHVDVSMFNHTKGNDLHHQHCGSVLYLYYELYALLTPLFESSSGSPSIRGELGSEVAFYDYPKVAIIEALVNFLIHRDYSADDIGRITLYDDRIEFENPGVSTIAPEILLSSDEPQHPLYRRNPRLIEAMSRARLNQREGRGIIRIKETLERNRSRTTSGALGLQIYNDSEAKRFKLVIFKRVYRRRTDMPNTDFLSRVETLWTLREPKSKVERIPQANSWGDYLRICRHQGDFATLFPVGAAEHGVSTESLHIFLNEVVSMYRLMDRQIVSIVVYGGEPAGEDVAKLAKESRVHLLSFIEFQGLIDFRTYVQQQTDRLARDPIYPPTLYVSQRMRHEFGRYEMETSDALAEVQEWLSSPYGRFVVLLGDFGTGKTFLLHELARRMGEENGGLVPILLQMRSLEKGRDLDSLLAQHFAQEGVEDFSPRRFRYMLEQGRVALLFDGFDELALRVTFDRATEHFDTLLQAGTGMAKVVVTSRRQHFLSEQQVKTVLAERAETVPGHRLAILQPFNRDQIRTFLVKSCGDERSADKRIQLIDQVKDLLGLSHNPRLLSFIAELPEKQLLEAERGEGEITAAKLYELLLNRWLVGEFERVHLKGAPPGLSVEERWRGVTSLALHLWEKTDLSAGLSELTENAARVIAALDPSLAAFQLGSGTLLVRDDEGNFSFLHQSILEWLVARDAAEKLKSGTDPEPLAVRQISPLMADFLSSLAGRATLADWARRMLARDAAEAAKTNALLVLERLKEPAREPVRLTGQDLRGKDLSYQDLREADLTGADLIGARLIETRLERARLVNARLMGANLCGAFLSGADLSGANLTAVRLLGADFKEARLFNTILRRAKLLVTGLVPEALQGCATQGAALDVPRTLDGLVEFSGPIQAVAWSPDAELFATAEANLLRLWEVSSGREIRRFQGHDYGVWSVAFSPDGQVLATGSDDNAARLWDVSSGREIRRFQGHDNRVSSIAFSPAGQALVTGSDDNTARLWDVSSGREIRRFQGHNNGVLSIAISPDGQALATGSADNTARLWNISSGREIRRFQQHIYGVLSVAFSPDGQALATGSDDKIARLWNISSGREIRRFQGHVYGVNTVTFSPNGQALATGSDDNTARLWDVSSGREIRRFQGHNNGVRSVAFSPDGQALATASDDKTARLWEVSSGREIRRFQGHDHGVWSVAFSPDGQALATGSYDNAARLWDVSSGREIQRFQGHDYGVRSVAFSPDGQTLATGSDNNTARLWDIRSGREIQRFQGHEDRVWSVAFSPDGQTLAIGSHNRIARLWAVSSGREIQRFQGHEDRVGSVTFSPDGQTLATGSCDKTARLWDASSGREIRRFQGHDHSVGSVAFSPDGQALATGSADNTARLWNISSGREIQRFQGHEDRVGSVAFSPDGQTLATGSCDKTARLWDTSSGREIRRFQGHDHSVGSVAFSPDGQALATGSYDNTIRLWNVSTGACLAILGLLPDGWVAFSPDGRYKLGGIPAGGFWHVINLCRFEAGELDDWIPGLRLPDNASFFDLPPWTPEVRRPASLRREK